MFECAQLIENAPERPHIRRVTVGLRLAHFWRHVVRRAHHCERLCSRRLEHFRNAEVAELNRVVPGQEYVLRFQISVEDFACVYMLERHTNLEEPVHDFGLAEVVALLPALLDVVGQVAHYRKVKLGKDYFRRIP